MVEEHQQIASLESKLERIRLRRSGLPSGFVLFFVLAVLLFGDEIRGFSVGTAAFAWLIAFGTACVLGLAVNEASARRSIRSLEVQLKLLRDAGHTRSLGEGGLPE
ncbi:MAG: hypothetical protein PVJ76_00640 [Gemmatimonadota bacterium]|jgi:hypothetical protein